MYMIKPQMYRSICEGMIREVILVPAVDGLIRRSVRTHSVTVDSHVTR
jgi:hypothetical protein